MRRVTLVVLPMLALLITACGNSGESASATESSSGPAWMLASAPEGARSVTEIKADASEGDEVVMRARIGGRVEPMSAGSPVFTVMDLEIPPCTDQCAKPWDYCCETPETITANAATVQVVGRDGAPATVMPDAAGLKPLDEIVLVGKVGPRPDPDVLTVVATGLYRVTSDQ